MKLCPKCRKTPWPFLFALFIAAFTGFLTWVVLLYSQIDTAERILWSGVVFVAAAATLVHYVVSCMRRHCRHDRHHPANG
jgi:high-affinity Fe2+/Pb2+ permease